MPPDLTGAPERVRTALAIVSKSSDVAPPTPPEVPDAPPPPRRKWARWEVLADEIRMQVLQRSTSSPTRACAIS